jgi:phage-related tail protein
MAINQIKKLREDLEKNTSKVIGTMNKVAATATFATTAAYAGTASFATTAATS